MLRKVFRNPRLYVAGLVSLPMTPLHVSGMGSSAIEAVDVQFRSWASLWVRIRIFWELYRSYVLYGGLILIELAGLAWRRQIAIKPIRRSGAA